MRHVFPNEQRYYELLVEKSVSFLCLFPYHLADIVTKGLRVTPFNYYLNVIGKLLQNDKSYDTLPNFTAADCERKLFIFSFVHFLIKLYNFLIQTFFIHRPAGAGHRSKRVFGSSQ